MTDEKRYGLVCEMIRDHARLDYPDDSSEKWAEKVICDPQTWQYCAELPFYANAAKLLLEAKQNMDKAKTGAGRMAAITRVYKSAASAPREDCHGAFRSGDLWAICDGYRLIRLSEKPESVPECRGIDLSRAIPKDAEDAEQISLPAVAEIKAYLSDVKARYGGKWIKRQESHFEAIPGWWCNPQYLLDMVQAIPDGVAYMPKTPYSPLYFKGSDGDGLLLPCRHSA